MRAFSLQPKFATFASDEKVNYLASHLQGLARGTAEQFSVVQQRIASQPPSPAPMFQDADEVVCESVDERLNAMKNGSR